MTDPAMPDWTPFERATLNPVTEEQITGMMKSFPKFTREQVELAIYADQPESVWLNSRYQVNLYRRGDIVHLSIKRLDKDRVGPERYRDFMRIKDELVGSEREAVEIYPARSRETDTANQYHLWVMPPMMKLPFGFDDGRNVVGESNGGARQHPFDEEHHIVD